MRFLLIAAALFILPFSAQADDSLNNAQKDEVRNLVRETLLSNPEILMEAMEILQIRQEQAKMQQQQEALKTAGTDLYDSPLSPKAGNPKGDITMVEFFDYQCGYCKRAFPGVMDVINSDQNVRYILKEFAILGPMSEVAARAALAADKQGKYMEFHTAMMTVRGGLTEDKIFKTAESIGLAVDRLKNDMKADDVSKEIQDTRQLAQKLGITGTPAFIIGDAIIPGAVPASALKEAIAAQRALAKK